MTENQPSPMPGTSSLCFLNTPRVCARKRSSSSSGLTVRNSFHGISSVLQRLLRWPFASGGGFSSQGSSVKPSSLTKRVSNGCAASSSSSKSSNAIHGAGGWPGGGSSSVSFRSQGSDLRRKTTCGTVEWYAPLVPSGG